MARKLGLQYPGAFDLLMSRGDRREPNNLLIGSSTNTGKQNVEV